MFTTIFDNDNGLFFMLWIQRNFFTNSKKKDSHHAQRRNNIEILLILFSLIKYNTIIVCFF